jgi:hypothetical protein
MKTAEELREELAEKIRRTEAAAGVATNFPKSLPATGIAYSRNFQAWLTRGIFAGQVK